MKLKPQADPEASIDMTPMIDCVFLLIIFFMVSATMSKVDMTPEVKLPIAPKAAKPEDDDLRNRGTINIIPVGSVHNGITTTEALPFIVFGRNTDDAGLAKAVSELAKGNPDLRIYMRVDKDTDFKIVRRAIRACATAGVYDIIFATFQEASPG